MSVPTVEWDGWRISTVTLSILILLFSASVAAAWVSPRNLAGRERLLARLGCLTLAVVAWLLALLLIAGTIVGRIGIAV
ncbi:MAG: hypothetical protein HY875_08750 [Chloroflexi bacterium]|nr:hypothetical protein [Chloroflexota bacterium]